MLIVEPVKKGRQEGKGSEGQGTEGEQTGGKNLVHLIVRHIFFFHQIYSITNQFYNLTGKPQLPGC